MQVIGSIIILGVLVGSYLYFSQQEKKEIVIEKIKEQNFYLQLETLKINQETFKVVLAGGDDNNENPVDKAIEKIVMPKTTRIKNI